ncbi:YeeE/YedE family protein [Novosphingobium clariflavum]|uniref:YeeE/YedE family protein n=1 Tax=Novosphingobium clariflavum TaxID=2029884 RepID=A0ABV6SAI7_9SPHN|nr:YeeE/YedE thiosulfate transporter family protein [Novosphingobium clariflavum]
MIPVFSEIFPHAAPLRGLVGGGLIGLAAAIMLLGNGRIAGVSGLLGRTLALGGGTPWSIAASFIAGLPLGALLLSVLLGPVPAHFPPSLALLGVAGLITGIGTRLGSGCTSGHGVCGMSRLSPRSLLATATFMASGMATVALVNLAGAGW